MATHTAAFSVGPKTLSTTTVDTVTLTTPFALVDVHNLSGTADLTVTVANGTAPSNPSAGANDNWCVPAGRSRTIRTTGRADTAPIVKVLGNGNGYLVEGVG